MEENNIVLKYLDEDDFKASNFILFRKSSLYGTF